MAGSMGRASASSKSLSTVAVIHELPSAGRRDVAFATRIFPAHHGDKRETIHRSPSRTGRDGTGELLVDFRARLSADRPVRLISYPAESLGIRWVTILGSRAAAERTICDRW